MPKRPRKPPMMQKEEDLSEKEMEEVVKEAAEELHEEERQEESLEKLENRPDLQSDISRGWDQLLKPNFQGSNLEKYEGKFKSYLLSAVPIANIRRKWIPRYLTYFDENWVWMKAKGIKLPPYLWASFRMIFELNLTRAIGGIQREIQRESQFTGRELEQSIEKGWNKYIEPDFENTELEYFSDNFKAALSNVVPLANIQEADIENRYLLYFDEIWQWMKVIGLNIHPQGWDNFRFTLEINLTKSIQAFEMKQQGNVRPEKEETESKGILENLLDTIKGGF